MFAFEKVTKPSVSKTSWAQKDGWRYIGGLPVQDNRTYLRFEKSNREELAQEYFLKRKPDEPIRTGAPGAVYGARKARKRPKED